MLDRSIIDGMTTSADTASLSALESQHSELVLILRRLRWARRELVPPPSTFWMGTARRAYDAALVELEGALETATTTVQLASDSTRNAVAEITARA